MALEALSTNEILDFLIHDTLFASKFECNDSSGSTVLPETSLDPPQFGGASVISSSMTQRCHPEGPEAVGKRRNSAMQGRKKRKRRQNVCKNKEEAETQRMTHIVVERNRRKQMNDHLAVLRSLMPESYVHRGDQASIVGAAIEYVKELEHLLQSLEAQKLLLLQGGMPPPDATTATAAKFFLPPFSQFIALPHYTLSQVPNKNSSKNKTDVADIEVTLIETHANLRILSRKSLRQISKLVTGFQTLYLTVLHLNVTSLDPLVLYTISVKVEEGCQLKSADDIAGAVHRMLGIIVEESIIW